MFLDTLPAPIDSSDPNDPWAEFRVSHPGEIGAYLRQIRDQNLPVILTGSGGATTRTSLWAIDQARDTLSFAVMEGQAGLRDILSDPQVTLVAYDGSVKLQFTMDRLSLVQNGQASALQCESPSVMYRLQRRGTYRVRTPDRQGPLIRMRHPDKPEQILSCPIIDLSLGGCGFRLADGIVGFEVGRSIQSARVELSAETRFVIGLEIRRNEPDEKHGGQAIGCAWLRLDASAERQLQLYIDNLQKKRRLMTMR